MQGANGDPTGLPFTAARKPKAQQPTLPHNSHTYTDKVIHRGERRSPIHGEPKSKGTKGETNMGKILVIILATMAACWLVFLMVGPSMSHTAFNIPHFGSPVSWMMVVGGCIALGVYKIIKGK